MGNKYYYKDKGYRLIDQQLSLLKNFPEGKCHIHRGVLYWEGEISPSPVSRTYHTNIIYKYRYRPQVIISGDNLLGLDRDDFPHKFQIDHERNRVKICLHLPGEFDPSKLISDYIIPWVSEWLFFYEIWLSTGEWCGGGHQVN